MNTKTTKPTGGIEVKRYLKQLSVLSGRPVSQSDLMPVSCVEPLREASRGALIDKGQKRFELPFAEKTASRFRKYIDKLHLLNAHDVYIWTELTNSYGLFKLNGIRSVDFSFPFDVDSNGVITLLTYDCRDCLLLDFSEDPSGERRLEVEVTGANWPTAEY